jgi:carbonic anhydrase/acetyltransferase-like protein (isoleucine patch superfamily)
MSLFRLGDKHPRLPENDRYFIAPGAVVLGDVRLGQDANIWFGAVLRGDNDPISIGARSNIQDGSVLHTDVGSPLTIGDDVTVGHKVMLHGCTIGDGSLIGIGAIILNRAVIGRNSIVGAGSLVTEGKVYPDGVMLMGSPARVVRELMPEQIAALKMSAAHYVQNANRFRDDLKPMPVKGT